MWGRRPPTAAAPKLGSRDRLRLALQKALVGQVTPEMRLVSIEPSDALVRVVVYYDRSLPDDDRAEFADEVASVVGLDLGDPPAGPEVACHFLRCDDPQRVPVRGEIVFARKGVRTA